MEKKTYLCLQIKRAAKIYPTIIIITLITLLSIALTVAALLYANSKRGDKTKIQLGIVGDTEENHLGIGITALENFDSSRFSINFEELPEEEAEEKLKKRELSGYIVIPDNFVRGIVNGENKPATYVVPDEFTGFETVLLNEIAEVVSDWITLSQRSIYSMQKILYDFKCDNKYIYDYSNQMNMAYISCILGRQSTYETIEIGTADSISFEGYYLCGIILFFLLIWGITCNKLFLKKNFELPRMLNSRGIKYGLQVFAEYLSFLIFTLVTMAVLAVLCGIVLNVKDFGIRELKTSGVFSCIIFVFKILPVIMTITMMQMMLYEMVSGTVNAIVLQFIVALCLAYISGCFYPVSFFPEAMQAFAAKLPSGAGFSYMRRCITGLSVSSDLKAVMGYFVIFALVTVIIRKYRAAGDMA